MVASRPPSEKETPIHWYYWPLIIWLGGPFIFLPLWHIAIKFGRKSWDPPAPHPLLLLEGPPMAILPIDSLIHTANELSRCIDNIANDVNNSFVAHVFGTLCGEWEALILVIRHEIDHDEFVAKVIKPEYYK